VTADDVGVCRQMPNEIVSRNRLVQPIPVQEIGMDECEIGFREVILYEFDAAIGQVVVNGNAIPCETRMSTTWLPMNPAPPVRKTFLMEFPSNMPY